MTNIKYLKYILLVLLFPILVLAEECDVDKISISSITIQNKTENVLETNEATISGKIINLDLSMEKVGDRIEYKFVIQNDSNEDYELDKNSFNMNSNYIN